MTGVLDLLNSFYIGGSKAWNKTHVWGNNVGASICRFASDVNSEWLRKRKRGEMPTCKTCLKLVKIFEIDELEYKK